jgi:uncharacterized membrane protein
MTRLLTLIFLSIFAYSCSTKKAVTSTVNDLKVDSVYKEKKDSVSFRKNSVVITEDVYEMEIVPIDSTKPIFIDDKEYKNAAIKIKKSEKSFVDSTQVTVLESLDKNIEVEKNSITKNYDKEIERKPNYLIWVWLFIILVVIFGVTKLASKFLL